MTSTVALASEGGAPMRLCAVLRGAPYLMEALLAARDADPPDRLIGAGAVRDAIWDASHDRPATAMPRDIDLGFFDPNDLTPARDQAVQAELRARARHLPWQAKNQAAVHLWYPRRFGKEVPPFRSSAEAVATFPDTATCVGVRLLADDDMLVVAPHGLDDLLDCICPPQRHARVRELLRTAGRAEGVAQPMAEDAIPRPGPNAPEHAFPFSGAWV